MDDRPGLLNALPAGLALLLVWAAVQVAGPMGLSVWLCATAGLVLAAALFAWHRREGFPGRREAGPWDTFTVAVSPTTAAWTLIAIVGVALVLRVHTLMERPTWEDEMWTLRNMYTADWGELLRVAFDDYWPPLHYLILNSVARVADTSLIWLRIPSVIFGTATVAVMYPLGRLLFRSRVAGLAAAALMAGMTTHVLYSQEARVYALQILLAVLSAFFFYRSYWERRISPAFLITTTLLTYSHSFATWYFIAGQVAYVGIAWLIWRDDRAFVKGFTSQVLVVVLWLPLVAAFAYSRLEREILVPTHWATAPEVPPVPWDAVALYQGLAVRSWAGAAFMATLFALALIPVIGALRRRGDGSRAVESRASESGDDASGFTRGVVFLLCWITVPVVFSLVVTVASSLDTFGEIRYHMTVLPGMCLLAVAGMGLLRSRASLAMVGGLLVLLPAAQLPRYYTDFPRDAVDEAAAVVAEHASADENIYIGNGFRAFAYYHRGIFPRIGSPQWDSLAASHASFADRRTLESVKWGDTYAYEKISPRIAFFGYYRERPDRYDMFIRDDLARGGFQGSFWLIFRDDEEDDRDERFLRAFEDAGLECADPRTYRVPGLVLHHCNPT